MVMPFSNLIREDLAGYCPASNLAFNEQVRERIAKGEEICHLAFGQSPFPVPELAQQGLRDHAHEHAYLPARGLPELRELIIGFHRTRDRLTHFQPDHVVLGPGSKELLFLCMQVFNGDLFITNPTWTTYQPQSRLAGNEAIVIPKEEKNGWKLRPECLKEVVLSKRQRENGILIFCNPDNPTGVAHSREELQELATVCRELRLIVVSDEIYARTHFKQNFSSIAEFYPEGTIVTSGFSKWSSAGGWRVGYALFPEALTPLHAAVTSAATHTYSCAPAPMQHAVIALLKDEAACESYIRHTSRILQAVCKAVCDQLTEVGVQVVPADASFYVMPNFEVLRPALTRRGLHSGAELFALALAEAGVALMSAHPGFLAPTDSLHARLCFVDFNGAAALEESRRLGLEQPLPSGFVEVYCGRIFNGMRRLCKWVTDLTSEDETNKTLHI